MRITGSIVIHRPPADVFDFVADERNEPTYNPRMRDVEKLTPGPIGVGTSWRATVLTGRRPTDLTLTVTGYDRPNRLGSTAAFATGDITGSVSFAPHPTGTLLSWSWELRPRGLVRLATPVIAVVGSHQEMATWTLLKRHLETVRRVED